MTNEEIEVALSLDIAFSEKIESICELALKNGSTDNVSAIGIKSYETDEEFQNITKNHEEIEPVEEEPEIEIAVEEKEMAEQSIAKLEEFITELDQDV